MPLYNNKQASSIEINNSFSARNSGDKVIYSKGNLFSNSGFSDNSFYVLNTGEIINNEDLYLKVDVDPISLYATGTRLLNNESLKNELTDEENTDSLFYFKSSKPNPFSSNINGDFLFFKNEGESSRFNCSLIKTSGEFILTIGSGNVNSTSISDKYVKKIILEEGSKGQKIFIANYNNSSETLSIESVDEFSYRDQQSYPKNEEEETWEIPDSYDVKIPLCIVDFDRVCVSKLFDNNIVANNSVNSVGINDKGYVNIG